MSAQNTNNAATHAEDGHANPTGFVRRWLYSTNHKDIGTMYIIFSILAALIGGGFSIFMRMELMEPGVQYMADGHVWNVFTTAHGLIMVFFVVMPGLIGGFGNWFVPIMIGAPDMALPRLNNLSFWILPAAFGVLLATFFMEGGAPNFGWTFYAPLSTEYAPPTVTYFIFAVHIMGASSIMGSINVITTILNMRAPGMTLMKMPLFVWSWLITAYLLIAVMPVLAGAVTMMLMDIHFGTSFFKAGGGGDPVLFQHIFWFFGHPEVYIMILPAFGIVSHIIETFSRKPIFGYDSMVYAIASIALLSFVVWAHHMFTVGMPIAGELFFMYSTMLIAIPTGVKVFNWLSTMFKGSLTFETPMLFAIAFVALFTIGGLSGLMLAIAPADFQYHDTYFVVAHFHYVLVPGALFSIIAAVYYWLPKWTGYMYDEFMGKTHFWLSFVSVNLTFFPMHFVGLAGLSQLHFLYVVLKAIFYGKKATGQVWEGAQGLEWTLDSPPAYHTFETPPNLEAGEAKG